MSKQYLTIHTIDDAHITDIFSLAVTPTDVISASGSSSLRIHSTSPPDFPLLQSLENVHNLGCHHVTTSKNGAKAASVGFGGRVIVWSLKERQWVKEGNIVDGNKAGEIWAIALSEDGQYLASTTYDGRINVWDNLAERRKIREYETKGSFGTCIDLSVDGRFTASGHENGGVYIFNNDTGRLLHSLLGLVKPIRSIAFSPATKLLAAAGDACVIALYDVSSGEQVANLMGHGAWIMSLDFSNTGEYLLSGAFDGKAKVWSIETRSCVATHTETEKTLWAVKWLPKTARTEGHPDVQKFKPTALRMAKAARHRGPDWSGNYIANSTILAHERLSIVGVESGAQPLLSEDGVLSLAVNGEIYNHRILRKQLKQPYHFKTHSDCEVILPLWYEFGLDTPNLLDGMFSFVLYDKASDRTIAARDPIGITTFYQGWSSQTPGAVYFASELKCLHPVCDKIISFPPGHVYDSKTNSTTRFFQPVWWDPLKVPNTSLDYKLIRRSLERSVKKRLMAEVPYGVLLSGGLDSSLVASIAQRETLRTRSLQSKRANGQANHHQQPMEGLVGIDDEDELSTENWLPQLHSFSIGLPDAPDTKAALEVAQFLGTKHYNFTFTIDEGLDALSDVIYHLETYDVTTIRASTPMFLLSRKIKAMGVKMVLSGEGSDEIFGGYLYFHAAPNKEAFHEETVRRIKNLHLSDCLRANKSTAAWGVEARVPFLDKQFLNDAMAIEPSEKMITKSRIEKYILRKAFDTTDEPDTRPYLPDHILWRQKEQFSDGVGYGWIDALKDNAKVHVTDEQMKNPRSEWGDDVPDTKEAYWYRTMFDEHFPPYCASTVMRWAPTWSKETDPSGRAIATHVAKYGEEN